MKLLIVGASGQAGSCLMRAARNSGHDVFGTYRSKALSGLFELDLQDRERTAQLCAVLKPDWVIDCACWSWVDGNQQDPARAKRENIDTVENAALAAKNCGAQFCYFSSSYVFDGKKSGAYTEDDPISPISVYAETKAKGESLSREISGGSALIVRTMTLYGPDPQNKNFFDQVIRAGREKQALKVPHDQLGNPTFGPDLAEAVVKLVDSRASGIYNVAGEVWNINRVDFARAICTAAKLDASFIQPVSTAELRQPAPRPLNGGLSIEKLRRAGIVLRAPQPVLEEWRSGGGRWRQT